jgi:ABC-2 type transport system ATP-binding protein
MIEVRNLTKRYGELIAVRDISFSAGPGQVLGFLGPNGAGKTTTMRIISCFLPASGGRVTVAGMDVFADSLEVRKRIGYLPENAPVYTDMRVIEYLKFRGRLKGLRGKKLRNRLDDVISSCGLGEARR